MLAPARLPRPHSTGFRAPARARAALNWPATAWTHAHCFVHYFLAVLLFPISEGRGRPSPCETSWHLPLAERPRLRPRYHHFVGKCGIQGVPGAVVRWSTPPWTEIATPPHTGAFFGPRTASANSPNSPRRLLPFCPPPWGETPFQTWLQGVPIGQSPDGVRAMSTRSITLDYGSTSTSRRTIGQTDRTPRPGPP